MIRELGHAFIFYDRKAPRHKILQLQKAPDESIAHFYDRFGHYCFKFLEDEVD